MYFFRREKVPKRGAQGRDISKTVWLKLIVLAGIEFHPLEGALFLAPEKGRKRAPPQGATKITFKREIRLKGFL